MKDLEEYDDNTGIPVTDEPLPGDDSDPYQDMVALTPEEYQDLFGTPPPAKRSIKQTTGYALGGFTVGTALAAIAVWILAQIGIDAAEIQEPLGFVLQAAGVTFGGWAAPPTQLAEKD